MGKNNIIIFVSDNNENFKGAIRQVQSEEKVRYSSIRRKWGRRASERVKVFFKDLEGEIKSLNKEFEEDQPTRSLEVFFSSKKMARWIRKPRGCDIVVDDAGDDDGIG